MLVINATKPTEHTYTQQTSIVRPNQVTAISPEQAELLDRVSIQSDGPTPALIEAFAQRKLNQARSRYHR
jgi:hypothetical protein